ncbi:MAG: hypothetical protein ABW352_07850 [Polyangiales bacterium]
MRRFLLSLALLSPLACERQVAPAKPAEPTTGAPATAAPAADPHAGIAPSAAAVPTEPARAGGLTWEAQDPFVRRAPKSSMRAAEYGLKGAPAAELGVFYFGPDQGGSVEANMSRWIGQFTQADGSETKAKRSEVTHNGVQISLVEANGMFSGGMAMPGAPQPTALPDAALLGAIAKGPEGSVFFKLTGPRDAIEGSRAGFEQLLKSITKN